RRNGIMRGEHNRRSVSMLLSIDVLLPLSLGLIMFSLGLGLTLADFRRVLEAPLAVLAGLTAQMLLLPIAAFGVAWAFALPPEMGFGLMILAACPGGVTSNILTKLAGGALALSITLTGLVSLLSVVSVPLLTAWMAEMFLAESSPEVEIGSLALAMVLITALPVMVGIALRHFLPVLVARVEPWIARAANVLFVAIVLLAVASGWEDLTTSGLALVPALVTLIVALLALGLLLAGLLSLKREQRICIALETGVQNATMGITIATLVAGGAFTAISLPSAVYGVVMYLVVAPFILWCRRK
ncbi:MAG: bile acid:sodium symporter family protein, partial [Pseudomonadota bacterium]